MLHVGQRSLADFGSLVFGLGPLNCWSFGFSGLELAGESLVVATGSKILRISDLKPKEIQKEVRWPKAQDAVARNCES